MANWANSANFLPFKRQIPVVKEPCTARAPQPPAQLCTVTRHIYDEKLYLSFSEHFSKFSSRPHAKLNTMKMLGFSFSVHFFFSKFASRPQAKLNTIYENFRVFMFHPLPVSMQNMWFRVSQKHNAIFLLLIFFKLQYPGIKMLHMVPCIAFLNQFLSKKNTTAQTWTTTDRQWHHSRTETSSVATLLSILAIV